MDDERDMDPRRRELHLLEGKDGVLRVLANGHLPSGHSPSDVKRVLSHALALTQKRSLLPPAEAAFLGKPGVEIPDSFDLALVTRRLLEACLANPDESVERVEIESEVSPYVAFRYAEALVRQEEVVEALSRVDELNAPLHAALPKKGDRVRLDEYLLYRNVRGRFETLDSLVDGWARAVACLEHRPELHIHDEYADWLASRDSLEDALSVLSPMARNQVEVRVGTYDERFLAATHAVSTSIWPRSPWKSQRWWWFRLPLMVGEHFRTRLEHLAPAAAQELAAEEGPTRA